MFEVHTIQGWFHHAIDTLMRKLWSISANCMQRYWWVFQWEALSRWITPRQSPIKNNANIFIQLNFSYLCCNAPVIDHFNSITIDFYLEHRLSSIRFCLHLFIYLWLSKPSDFLKMFFFPHCCHFSYIQHWQIHTCLWGPREKKLVGGGGGGGSGGVDINF